MRWAFISNRVFIPAVLALLALAPLRARAVVNYGSAILYPVILPSSISSGGPSGEGAPETAAGGQLIGFGDISGGQDALLWTSTGLAIDLNPTNLSSSIWSVALGTSGSQQVGYGQNPISYAEHALVWSGTAASAVDLNPTGFNESVARGTDGIRQVGYGSGPATGLQANLPTYNSHALLWSGIAGSVVDLNPNGYDYSGAYGISGNHEVGYGGAATFNDETHAMLWSDSAQSAVDLNPSNFTASIAFAADGDQQVGYAFNSGAIISAMHAMLWLGTAASAIDLNPVGASASEANDTNGIEQVGYADMQNGLGVSSHALLWFGSAASLIDLQSTLPPDGIWTASMAYTIDPTGNIFGTASGTYNGFTGYFAVEWSPVPEPAAISMMIAGSIGVFIRCRRASQAGGS